MKILKYEQYPSRSAKRNYFPLPNEIFSLELSTGESATYAFIVRMGSTLWASICSPTPTQSQSGTKSELRWESNYESKTYNYSKQLPQKRGIYTPKEMALLSHGRPHFLPVYTKNFPPGEPSGKDTWKDLCGLIAVG